MTIKWMDVKPHPGGYIRITAVVDGNIEAVSKIASETASRPHELSIKPVSKKRSLDANGYYWVLLDKLAGALRANKREIHRQLLARYGVTDTDSEGKPLMFQMLAEIDPTELGEIYVDAVDSHDGYIVYRVLKGSSKMNTKEFSILLDGLISECKELGIEVLPDEELQRLFQIQEP